MMELVREVVSVLVLWARELAGWALVLIGLVVFYIVYDLALSGKIFEGWLLVFVGFFIFRGGIALLRVAIATRTCKQAQDRLYPAGQRGPTSVR
jgi:hypothetical protein